MEFIAHRAGNDAASLRFAEGMTNLVEVDVHLGRRGRVEVRHAKNLWFTRRLWEKWHVLPADTAVPALLEIVNAADPSTHLWLDLKGYTSRLSRRTLREIGERRPLTVSTKAWWILGTFAGIEGVRTIRSAGNRFELALLTWLPLPAKGGGIVVHHRLLTDRVLERLTDRSPVFTWAVHDVESIERLARLGVAGVILDDLTLVESGRVAITASD